MARALAWVAVAILLGTIAGWPNEAPAADQKPDVIVLLGDDLG